MTDSDRPHPLARFNGNSRHGLWNLLTMITIEFDKQSYWQHRFSEERAFEWLIPSDRFLDMIQPQLDMLPPSARILNLGCGNSDLQNHFRSRGFLDVTNVDYEPLALQRGQDLEREAFGDVQMHYVEADVTKLALPGQYDLIIDKSTADAVACGDKACLLRMAASVRACFSPTGIWISFSYSSDRFPDDESFPFKVTILHKVLLPKELPSEPDLFDTCYLLQPK
ncbi:S-adenosyl-L-methionine-dependent methyltransferase [Stachybotrys elegans]|uniref:S-adenosyl-L-methionine-dependent methyltransferase n=1 Tax=Stachybotrys elegans TaxID=80388 RepID=A0A8K0T087_9HYPO|nr:S-adenosyl-L-methionine-dependent methyltransferase [Stachybotrys elegans]